MTDEDLYLLIGVSLVVAYVAGAPSVATTTIRRGDPVDLVQLPPSSVTADSNLPAGYASDENVARQMFLDSMARHGLDPVAVQGNGWLIVNALKTDYPSLDVYAHRVTDAIEWPGFGPVDVTIDSGLGGFYFRPDYSGRFGEGR